MADLDPRDGTFCSYQGFPVMRCTFVLARGWTSSQSLVEIPFPVPATGTAGVTIKPPDLGASFGQFVHGVAPASTNGQAVARPALRSTLAAAGFLVMREVAGGVPVEVVAGPLFVTRAEEVRRPDGSPIGRMRLTLEDVRYLWARGLCPRWSFNRKLPSGAVALDSVKPNGEPFSRAEIAILLTSSLPFRPSLVSYPLAWQTDQLPLELPRFGAVVTALAGFLNRAGLEPPCLRLDGKVAFHAPGDGKIAAAANGVGPNVDPIAGATLDRDGTGRGRVVEQVFAEEWVVVVGGERIATVAIDDWQPILLFPDGQIRPLTEELVRSLTGGKFGLEWLRSFVIRPTAYQHHPDLRPEVGDLLADQAWQMFRLPGVEVEDKDGARAPGPNAHLLPLRSCAEVVNGRRTPVTVEAYSFTTQHVKLAGTPGQQALAAIKREIARLRENTPPFNPSVTIGPNGEVKSKPTLTAGDFFRDPDDQVRLRERGVTVDDLDAALTRARSIQQYEASPAGKPWVQGMTDLTKKQLEAEEAQGAPGGRSELFEAALLILESEKALRAEIQSIPGLGIDFSTGGDLSITDEQFANALIRREDLRLALLARVQPLLVKASQERDEQRRREETTGSPVASEEAFGVVVLSNRPVGAVTGEVHVGPDIEGLEGDALNEALAKGGTKVVLRAPVVRPIDDGARVVNAEAGIIRTSKLAGWINPDGAADPSYAQFVPRAVRVKFGTVVRPQVDVPPTPAVDTSGNTAANTASLATAGRGLLRRAIDRSRRAGPPIDPGGGNHVVPEVLSDQGTYYTSAWKRLARGVVERVDLDQVDLSRAVKLDEPDLVELVPLVGPSNIDDLDRTAETRARERTNIPDTIETARMLFGRPRAVSPDGVVAAVTITMKIKDGAPCGFETLVTTGSNATPPIVGRVGTTAVRGPAVAPRAAEREGLT
jgi:hypothetical protein